jgi:hypothetical protein
MRPFAPDETAFDEFVDQWFFDVVVPEYILSDPQRTEVSGANPGPEGAEAAEVTEWEVTLSVSNVGSGLMPVEVAAARGERFAEEATDAAAYRDARVTVLLGPDEETYVTLRCDFEPDRVLVDPDALVLQLEREDALIRF